MVRGGQHCDVRLTDNVSTGNIFGYSLFGDADLDHNSAIGNTSGGIRVEQSSNTVRISRSNIFGSGDSNQVLAQGIPRANCGVINRSGQPITATDNFWGAATGPGDDPADSLDVGIVRLSSPRLPKQSSESNSNNAVKTIAGPLLELLLISRVA
jgi:hypothetical protein